MKKRFTMMSLQPKLSLQQASPKHQPLPPITDLDHPLPTPTIALNHLALIGMSGSTQQLFHASSALFRSAIDVPVRPFYSCDLFLANDLLQKRDTILVTALRIRLTQISSGSQTPAPKLQEDTKPRSTPSALALVSQGVPKLSKILSTDRTSSMQLLALNWVTEMA